MMTDQEMTLLRVGKAAQRLGLNPFTLRRWIKAGKVKAVWVGREARISLAEVERLLRTTSHRVIVLYGRVSRAEQYHALQRQLDCLTSWAAQERPGSQLIVLSDIAGGLTAAREGLQHLLTLVQARTVHEVVVTAGDRLTHVGLEYLQVLFTVCEVQLTILQTSDPLELEDEFTEDVHAFLTARA
jgi:excisionase family DNA binding protein